MCICVSGTERTFSGIVTEDISPLFFVKGSLGDTELLDLTKLVGQPALGILQYTSMPGCFFFFLQWILGIELRSLYLEGKGLLVEPPPAPNCGSFVFSRIVWVSHAWKATLAK